VVPTFYFKNAPYEGLRAYFCRLLYEAGPENGPLLLYHIPQVTQVPITFELIDDLLAYAPEKAAGIKDSSYDIDHFRTLCERFPTLAAFAGSDRHLLDGLKFSSAGRIIAEANVLAPLSVAVYRTFVNDHPGSGLLPEKLTAGRAVLEKYMPLAITLKFLLGRRYNTAGSELSPPYSR
jgi:4-hydroxy-tetrahydrodipicolinate synthase